jgi:nucleotide-binding universal stress UspA family protein
MTDTDASRTTPAPTGAGDADYASVLVPLDGSRPAERALGPARALATSFGADLHLVADAGRRDEQWWYGDYLHKLRAAGEGVTTHLTEGPHAAPNIVALARDMAPCLVCMASHGRARNAALTGSVLVDVARGLGAPLVAVGPHVDAAAPTAPLTSIAVCLDGGPAAEQAIPVVAAWARRLDARVMLLTAADPLVVHGLEADAERWAPDRYPPDGDPEHYLTGLAARPPLAGLAVDHQLLRGPASPPELVAWRLGTHPVSLVAAATHARTGLARAALGSVTARLVHDSGVPVLVIPIVTREQAG